METRNDIKYHNQESDNSFLKVVHLFLGKGGFQNVENDSETLEMVQQMQMAFLVIQCRNSI